MSHLSQLKLSTVSPRAQLTPVARKRLKLLEQLDVQIQAAEHAVRNEPFAREVRRWVKIEGSNDKQLVTQSKPVRPWWWTGENGQIMVSLRQGARVMEVGAGKQSIEVGVLSDLPGILTTIRAAVVAGELDEQLGKPMGRPIPPKRGSKA
jgi:predicted exporter